MYDEILDDKKAEKSLEDMRQFFDTAEPAPSAVETIPKGEYLAYWIKIKVDQASTGTGRIVLTFKIIGGQYVGKFLWLDLYVTQKAAPFAKRELAKLDLHTSADWAKPVPHGIRCTLRVIVETDNDGKQRNKIADFKVVGVDAEQPDPFAPTENTPTEQPPPGADLPSEGDA